MKNNILGISLLLSFLFSGCNSFLDLEPRSALSPEQYLTTEENIGSYATDLYNMLPAHEIDTWGRFMDDRHTDNMAYADPSDAFAPGYWKVGQTGGSYEFSAIYRCNYFLNFVLPLYKGGKISGTESGIRHYIGEAYFFRAWSYYSKLRSLGDFPIVTAPISDNLQNLTEASKRAPRNQVARFILSDLDSAIAYMGEVPPVGGSNRLDKDCAHLFKSRVALYEGTWEKYFKGSAFVPGGEGWPGTGGPYDNANLYPSGNIDSEIEWFLETAMSESKIIADKYSLVENTGNFQNGSEEAKNPYFDMFGAKDMSAYPEIMLWRAYNETVGVANSVVEFAAAANAGYGITKSMVDAFVMNDGMPYYGSSSYAGDADITKVTDNRDSRARIFVKRPGERNLHSAGGPESYEIEPYPNIINSTNSMKYTTGYTMRKGLNFDGAQSVRNKSEVGCIVFRAAEAYLNYMEACYESKGNLDADATEYWSAIRTRAKAGDYSVTIENTDMQKEAEEDWGAWSAGKTVDRTLFNIRRERRCELMGEGFRNDDIHRWRAMDQMISSPYHVLGVNLWDELYRNEDFLKANSNGLIENQNVSSREFSKYLAPYHIFPNNRVYNGYRWKMAHYLDPIAVQHFLITGGGNVSDSPLYQNPGWPVQAGQAAMN